MDTPPENNLQNKFMLFSIASFHIAILDCWKERHTDDDVNVPETFQTGNGDPSELRCQLCSLCYKNDGVMIGVELMEKNRKKWIGGIT